MINEQQKTFLQRYGIFFFVAFVLLIGGLFFLLRTSYTAGVTASTATVVVSSPTPEAVLSENQFFVAGLHGHSEDVSSVRMFWALEGEKLRDEMFFDGSNFIGYVNTSEWDWKKDGMYELSFVAETTEGEHIATNSFIVHVGNVAKALGLSASTTAPLNDSQNTANAYQAFGTQTTHTPSSQTTEPKKDDGFWVEWVPAKITEGQRFVYHTDGHSAEEVNAFWKTEGGHLNSVYSSNTQTPFVAHINVAGWKWLGKGPYTITFLLTDKKTSDLLASVDFKLYWKGTPGESALDIQHSAQSTTQKTVQQTAQAPQTPPQTNTQPTVTLVPSGKKLFVPSKPAIERSLSTTQNEKEKEIITFFLNQPSSIWLNGDGHDTNEYIQATLSKATSQGTVPVFILYNIPQRDCGSPTSGGATSATEYKAWVDRLSGVFANKEALLLVEPDALAQLHCVTAEQQTERLELLRYAVSKLAPASPNLKVYIDAGHPYWVSVEEMARRLESVGVGQARGFSLNISNYIRTNETIAYGTQLSRLLGGKYFVIDTSRNGNGPSTNREWCNPGGRALGDTPVLLNGSNFLDALLWAKFPGESDGQCNGGPSAGIWWPAYAEELYRNRNGN